MMRLLALLLLVGCEDGKAMNWTWELSIPFTLSFEAAPEFGAGQIEPAFTAALTELGGSVDDSGQQSIHVRYSPDCKCSTCTEDTTGFVLWSSPDVINLCPLSVGTPWYNLNRTVMHEMGHALGLKVHLPCGDNSIMDAEINCEVDPRTDAPLMSYSPLDIQAICGAGPLKGCK